MRIIPAMHDRVAVNRPFEGNLIAVERIRIRGADGRDLDREVVRHPGAVAIVPVLDADPGAEGRLVLIRNRRIAVDATLWEVPAGKLEPGEVPIDAAARELEEETGYRAGRVLPLGRFYTSPGFTDELMHVFVADELRQVGQQLQPDEAIEVEALPEARIDEMITSGTIVDGKTIAAIAMWRLARSAAIGEAGR